jgi:hypothetical protein
MSIDVRNASMLSPSGNLLRALAFLGGSSKFDRDSRYLPYSPPGRNMPEGTGFEVANPTDQQSWSDAILNNPELLAAYTGGAPIDSFLPTNRPSLFDMVMGPQRDAGGFVQDEQGYYRNTNDPNDDGYYVMSNGFPVRVTPPMVPIDKPVPSTGDGGGGGGGSSSAGGSTSGGGDVGSLEPDPDLMGGGGTQVGTMPNPVDPSLPPVTDEPVTRSNEDWLRVVTDWLRRFPEATQAEKDAAVQQYGVPADVVAQAEAQAGSGSGTGGSGSDTGTGTGGTTPTVPTVPQTAPQTPSLPRPGPSPGSTPAEVTPGTGTGAGTGTGSGSGGGTGSLFGLSASRTSEMVFPELYQPKTERFTVLNNLLSNYYRGMV